MLLSIEINLRKYSNITYSLSKCKGYCGVFWVDKNVGIADMVLPAGIAGIGILIVLIGAAAL